MREIEKKIHFEGYIRRKKYKYDKINAYDN